ncbi:MAG: carbohydrate kinase family protein [Candidatus Woesearchaeota archaeon]|jgi:sugar/nucleoside kinase (ribokinase family)|nr:carbohydrate kinase family protein [Candidatus Woesearchaeota archaeon]MDP7324112.1 carbohydrate kinase family protein [Candidatus Woesearchaeota archaeon]MDP7457170.1 carbohydrate kinase family protein [Candidatus Woesearchaeota archaeon]
MYDVIAVGSATVDTFIETDKKFFKGNKYTFPAGAKLLVEHVNMLTGGSATNTAVGFARMGVKVAALCCIGVGNNSTRVVDELKKEGVDTRLVERDKKHRTGFSIIMDAAHHDRTIFAYKGSNDQLCDHCLNARALNTRWMYFGSLMGKSFQTMKKLAKMAHGKGIKIAFNPSLYLCKKGLGTLKGMLRCCEVVILNKEEAQTLFREKKLDRCLSRFRGLGVKIIVITDGGGDVHVCDNSLCYRIKPPKVRIVETTGAGDAFGSGFVSALIRGKKTEDALRVGLVNSQSVIRDFGAKKRLLRWKDAVSQAKKGSVKVVRC